MGFWSLDEKTQLALIMAGLMGASTAGCDRRTEVMDPEPPDAVADDYGMDAGPDGPPVADPLPSDMGPDGPPVSDMLPPDQGPDGPPIADPLPPDQGADGPPIADPLPPDASAQHQRNPGWSTPSRPGRSLPLRRDFRSRIQVTTDGEQLVCNALIRGADPRQLKFRWITSGGVLDSTEAQQVRWTPPRTPGRHMVQVTVRDGHGALSVDMLLHDVDPTP